MKLKRMRALLGEGIILEPTVQVNHRVFDIESGGFNIQPDGQVRGIFDNGKFRKTFKVNFTPTAELAKQVIFTGEDSYSLRQLANYLSTLADEFDDLSVDES